MSVLPIIAPLLTAPACARQAVANELRNRLDLRVDEPAPSTLQRMLWIEREHGRTVRLAVTAMVNEAGFDSREDEWQPVDPVIPWMLWVVLGVGNDIRREIEAVVDERVNVLWEGETIQRAPGTPKDCLDYEVSSQTIQRIRDLSDSLTDGAGSAIREIVDWAREVGPGSLEGLSMEQAFETSRAYWRQQSALAGPEGVRPGLVLYQWNDGATLQRLYTRKQLEAEGRTMLNCIGAKWQWEDVKDGDKVVLSYRDTSGSPIADISLLYKNDDIPYLDEAHGPNNTGVPFELCARLVPVLKEAGVETGGTGIGMYVPILVPEDRIPVAAIARSEAAFSEIGEIEDRIRQLEEERDYTGETTPLELELVDGWWRLVDHALGTAVIDECRETIDLLNELAGDRLTVRRDTNTESFKEATPLAWAITLDLDAMCAELYVSSYELILQWATFVYPWDADDVLRTDNYNKASLFWLLADPIFGSGHVQVVYARDGLPDWAKIEIPDGEWIVDKNFVHDAHDDFVEGLS